MSINDAISFAWKLVGTELCTGAGEDQDACYTVSPIVRAQIEGAMGTDFVPYAYSQLRTPSDIRRKALGEYLKSVGEALLSDA